VGEAYGLTRLARRAGREAYSPAPHGSVCNFGPRRVISSAACMHEISESTVSGDHLEDPDRPEPLQVNDRPLGGDRHLGDGPVTLAVEVHLAVDLQLGREGPAARPDRLEILRARVPAIEGDTTWLEAAGLGLLEHRQVVVVPGHAVLGLVVDPIVAGDDRVTIGPDQADQVDAPDDPLVLARPVTADQFDLLGVVLVEGRVVED